MFQYFLKSLQFRQCFGLAVLFELLCSIAFMKDGIPEAS